MKTFKLTALSVLVLSAALLFVSTTQVRAHEGEEHSEEPTAQLTIDGESSEQNNEAEVLEDENSEPAEQFAQEQEEQATTTYTYTAQPGDSYSLIARKAVQTFGIINNVSLSESQIIAAETYLTQAAGSPALNDGQLVTLQSSDVEAAIKRASELSAEEQALWQKYADNADFNTNNVGESRS